MKKLIAFCFLPIWLNAQINSFEFTQAPISKSIIVDTTGLKVENLKIESALYTDFIQNLYHTMGTSMESKAEALKLEIDSIFNSESKAIIRLIQKEQDMEKVKSLKRQLDDAESRKKSSFKEVFFLKDLAKEYYYKARTYRRFKTFPVRNSVEAQVYYNQSLSDKRARFLNASNINFGGKGEKISLFNEIYSDYYGPTRFSFGVLISNKSDSEAPADEKKEDAVQRLIGGGGNVMISLGLPILGYDSDRDNLSFKTTFLPKASIDVPTLGTENDEYGFNVDVGSESSIFYNGFLDVLTIFANYRFGIVSGNSIFYENLNKGDKNAFTLNQLSIGLAINSTFRLSWNNYWGGGFVSANFPNTISFSIVPHN
jgi:hypothetical protein